MLNSKILSLIAVISGGTVAFSETTSNYDAKYQIISEGSDASGSYWILGEDITGKLEGIPGTYLCWLSYNKCTIQLNSDDIYEDFDSYELRVNKNLSGYPTRGSFYKL